MQMKGKYSWVKHLDFMLVDLGALIASFFVVYAIKNHSISLSDKWNDFLIIIGLLNIVISLIVNPYSGILHRRYYNEIGKLFITTSWNVLFASLVLYFLKSSAYISRSIFIGTYVLYYFLSLFLKYGWKKFLIYRNKAGKTANKNALVIVSTAENAQRDIHSVYSTAFMIYDIKGVYVTDKVPEALADGFTYSEGKRTVAIPVIETDWTQFVLDNDIDNILVTACPGVMEASVYQKLIENGVSVNLAVETLIGFPIEEQFVSNIGINKALSVSTFTFTPAQNFYLMVKRGFDILFGLIGLLVLLPVSGCIKLAYLYTGDKEKIFYRQRRVGLNGKPIWIWKFRSMVPNAEAVLEELLKNEKYRREWEENQKFEHDPRVTKIGSILRKTSVDELPQILNVLAGDMSLVGPRPLVEGELAAHHGLKLYQKVKPGITGWWGCNGRSNIDYRERLELEYYYVKNCSLYLDVLCIIRSVWTVLKKDGAI